jgi:hypothetical protein
MKKLVVFFFLLVNGTVMGQMITAPTPLTFEANATNVEPGNFVVNWANNTEQILVSVSLDYHSGARLSFPTTTGLSLNTGYTTWSSVSSIVFFGTRDNINTALAAMTLSMGSIKTAVRINIEVSNYDANYKYNPINKHFYKYVSSSAITYPNAKSGAAAQGSFKGKTPYLVTITSQSEQDFINTNITGSNIWIALSDAGTTIDGTWKIDAGPELGTTIKTQNGPTAGNIAGQYNNWCSGEPNGDNHTEDYAVAKWNGNTCWNDLSATNSGGVSGYIVEISADFPAGSDYTGVYSSYIVHNNDMAFTLSSGNTLSTAIVSNKSNAFGGLQINDGHTYTVNSATTLNTNKLVLSGTGKIVFTDATSKWTPGTSNSTSTVVHSPTTNSEPIYWQVLPASIWAGDSFYANAPSPSTTNGYHLTPWIDSPQGWSVGANDSGQFIILNYPTPVYIAGIVTQGRQNSPQWVSKAHIDVSMNNSDWTRIYTDRALNSDQNTKVYTYFPEVQYAKYVRVTPTEKYGHMTMRLGLLLKQ